MTMYDPRPFSDDPSETSVYWRPKHHVGNVHAAICTGDSRVLDTEYGSSNAAVVATMLVWTDLSGDPAYRYDDVLVLQSHLSSQCSKRGLSAGRLTQPDRKYVFAPLDSAEWSKVSAWLSKHVDGETGAVNWSTKRDNGGAFVPPDEAPF